METMQENNLPHPGENFKGVDITYDGAEIISSVPFDLYDGLEKIENFDLKRDEDQAKTIEEDKKEVKEKQGDLKSHLDSLMKHNVELINKLSEYQRAFFDVVGRKTSSDVNVQDKPIDQLDEKLNSMYIKAKEDSIKETVEIIEEKLQLDKKIQKYADENPDIAEDKFKTFVVSTLTARYVETGKDFDEAVGQAIADFRKLTGTQNPVAKLKQAKVMAAHIEGSSQAVGEPVYTSQELVEMQLLRPDEYIRLQPKIIRAYKEGRVI